MAQLNIAKAPDKIETQALGSCVGIVLYDDVNKIGGLSHAMLPDINCASASSRSNLAKFVNTSIIILMEKMVENGAQLNNIKARLAGGANMFPDVSTDKTNQIGFRNVESARANLNDLGIEIVAEDVGGNSGRSIILDTATGKLLIKTIAHGEKEI